MNIEDSPPISEILDEISAGELNERLVSLPTFKCHDCEKFLKPPIMLVSGKGNVCGSCNVQNNANVPSIHNSAIEAVLHKLAIPCGNAKRGCKRKLEYINLAEHESNCSKRGNACPFKLFDDCDWEGCTSVLLQHCSEHHSDRVLKGTNNCFKTNIDILSNNEIINLLCFENAKFILRVKCDVDNLRLQYVMYNVGSIDKVADFTYEIEQIGHIGNNPCSLYYGDETKMYHDSEFTRNFDLSQALNVDLTFVKQIITTSIVSVVIKIIKTSHNRFNEQLLTCFECPVCNHLMKPPIFQCLSGHTICNHCRLRLAHCPTCHSGFGNTHNYALEAFSSNAHYPCVYSELGCDMVLSVDEINKHEDGCPLKDYSCPFLEISHCNWKGAQSSIVTHLKAQHANKTKCTNDNKMQISSLSDPNFTNLYCMVAYGEIFKVCHKRDVGNQNTYWAVQLVGPEGEAKNYKCEIGLIDCRNEHRKLIRTDVCQDLTNINNMFNQCITIPSNVTSWFTINGQITYFCKIVKMYVNV